MSTIGNVTLLPPTSTTSSSASDSSQSLTQQDFLKLMVAQFTQQDPLASSDGSSDGGGASDYINQLMSMTNLTTMQTMSGQQAMLLADTLPGATVDLSNNGAEVSGVVQAASMTDNGLEVTVNGAEYPATDIVNVDQTSAQAVAAAAAAANASTNSTTNNTTSN